MFRWANHAISVAFMFLFYLPYLAFIASFRETVIDDVHGMVSLFATIPFSFGMQVLVFPQLGAAFLAFLTT